MISTNRLALAVAIVGLAVWAGAIVLKSWDLLTAWLIWGTTVLIALLYELRRSKETQAKRSNLTMPHRTV